MVALDLAVEPGYHRFSIERADRADGAGPLAEMSFIVAPAACYAPPALQGAGRAWGVSAQLYGIRSEHNWGIGDFGDLGRLLDFCGEAGAAAVMLNPLHELFPGVPEHIFPYSPSSRCHFNALYLDVEAVPDLAECPEMKAMVDAPAFQARLRTLRAEPRVDYPGVAEVKSAVLEGLYRSFRERHLAFDSDRARAFHAFRAERGEGLRWQAIFDALLEDFRRQDPGVWGWPAWPEAYRDPRAPEVQAFLAAHLERVEYFEYLQWLAWEQLAQAGARSLEHRLGVGLVFDLAVGVAGGGAATWARQELHALGASAGAPPDEINRMGQDWGLPPWIPDQLTEACYEPFKELLRSQMALAGGLRLDHVMGLFRLFWVAPGLPIAEGRLRGLSFRGSPGHPRAGEPAQPLPGDRRGPGHGAGRSAPVAAADGGDVDPAALFRTPRRRPAEAALRLPRECLRGRDHPRPADPGGLLAGPGHRSAHRPAPVPQ